MARHRLNAVLFLGLLLAGMVSVAGCASSGSRGSAASRIDGSAAAQLQALAEAEASDSVPAPDVELPPGVDAAVLTPRPATDGRANLALSDMLAERAIPDRNPDDSARPDPPPAERRDRALRHYLRGRDEALQRRYFVAINELQKAQELDPASTAVIRELARSYAAFGSATRAATEYEKLLVLEPHSSEAVLRVAMAAANRRDFDRAVGVIASHLHAGRTFDEDPAAPILAHYALSVALEHLGYDRASAEAAKLAIAESMPASMATVYRAEYGVLLRQKGRIWRSIGDAGCRLQDYSSALIAYEQAARLPLVDPDAMMPRLMYAALKLGRPYTAQMALLTALQTPHRPVTMRHISLCEYLRDRGDTALLARSVSELYRSNADVADLARVAAALSSAEEAAAILTEFVDRQPRDLSVYTELIAWLVEDDPAAAIALTIAQAASHPDLARDYVQRLVASHSAPGHLIEQLRTGAASADRSLVETQLLVRLGAVGDAWHACRSAVDAWPDDRRLVAMLVEVSSLLNEPGLTEQAIAMSSGFDDADMWVTRARAHRVLRHTDEAMIAAEQALDRDASNIDALVLLAELAVVHVQRAVDANDELERQRWHEQARQWIDRAIELDPVRDDGYAVAFVMYGPPNGNAQAYQEMGYRLSSANPESELYSRLIAEQLLSQRRLEPALERLLQLYENDPSNRDYLRLAVTVWKQLDRTEAAERWLDDRLGEHPADGVLLGQWARVQFDLGRTDEATKRLQSLIDDDSFNVAAMQLFEVYSRTIGDADKAMQLGLQRLNRRPHGIQRELELAAMYIASERDNEGIAHLRSVLKLAEQADFDRLVAATSLAANLSDSEPRKNQIVLDVVEATVDRFPDAPFQVYGEGIVAMAGLNRQDDSLEMFVQRAIESAEGARGATIQDAVLWRNIAQDLVFEEHPDAASLALRARIDSTHPLARDAYSFLARAAIAADILVGDQVDRSIATARRLHEDQRLSWLFRNLGGESDPLAEAYYELGLVYSLGLNESGALRCLEEAIAIDPNFAMALNNLGYTRLEQNCNDPDTVAYIERAYALKPNDPNVLDTIGWLRYKQGRFADEGDELGAISLIKRSIELNTAESAEVLEHMGDALWRTGDTDGAQVYWQLAAGNSDSPDASALRQHQLRNIGLIIVDTDLYYNQLVGDANRRVLAKIRDATAAAEPPIAQTFEELKTASREEGPRNGRTQ